MNGDHVVPTLDHERVVAIMCSNVVIRNGLWATLSEVPGVSRVLDWTPPALPGPEEADLLFAAADDLCRLPTGHDGAVLAVVASAGDMRPERISDSGIPDGFVSLEDTTVAGLARDIEACLFGSFPMPAHFMRDVFRPASARPSTACQAVTPRERTTLELLADGLSNDQIARQLAISQHGVKRLVASLMGKLGAPNRTAAVVIAIQVGILPCPVLGTCH
jgi:two-component system nitrate/nitrite response regulator NarL